MNDQRLQSAYQAMIRRPPAGREGCPSPEALDALSSRRGAEEERLATLNHAMSCTECRRELDLLRAVGGTAKRPFWHPRVFALAATLMLAAGALLVWQATRWDAPDALRGTAAAVTLLLPRDGARVTAPPAMVWRAVPDAINYRIEVLDPAGAVVASGAGPDTTLQLAAGSLAPADSAYRWRVEAELLSGGRVSSLVRRVVVARP